MKTYHFITLCLTALTIFSSAGCNVDDVEVGLTAPLLLHEANQGAEGFDSKHSEYPSRLSVGQP